MVGRFRHTPQLGSVIMIRAVLASSLLLCVAYLCGATAGASTAADALFVVGPSKVQGGAGDAFVLDITTGSTEDIGAFQFTMSFDDSVLSLAGADPAEHFNDAGSVFCPPPALEPAELTFGCSIIGGDFVEGPTALAQLEFQFDQAMEATLFFELEGCLLAGPLGNALPVGGCKGVSVDVSGEPPAAPIALSPLITKIQAQTGSIVTIDVEVEGVTELGGFEFDVDVDPGKLTLTDASAGPFFAEGAFVCIFQSPFRDFGCVHQGKEQSVTGSGVIAHLEFTVKAPFTGPTAISLANCGLADEQGFDIPVSECGSATVQSNAAPPPVGGFGLPSDSGATGSVMIVVASFISVIAAAGIVGASLAISIRQR
jgi:hypothetical protein